jgi:RNA polymerase sigma-70 factor (ECF subfamily)
MHDDLAIAKRLLDGDESLFRSVFDGYFPRLYRFALSRLDGHSDEARDVVQHAFCKAFERLDTYRGEASLYGWILQICRNTLIDRARRLATRPRQVTVARGDDMLESIIESLQAPEDDQPDRQAARIQLMQIIQQTLDYLPSHYGNVLEWKYIEEHSVNEIADKLDIAPKAAESLLSRARKAFREAIVVIGDSADTLPFVIAASSEGRDYA